MKRLTVPFLLLLFIIASDAPAQIGKGTFLPGLNFNYNSSSQDYFDPTTGTKLPGNIRTTGFTLAPSFGYFFSDHFQVGLGAGYVKNKTTNSGNTVLTPEDITKTLAPFVRYYTRLGEHVYFFLHGEIGFGKGSQQFTGFDPQTGADIDIENPTRIFEVTLRPGVVYFITKRIGIEGQFGSFGYSRVSAGNDTANNQIKNITSGFVTNLSPGAMTLGLRYYISKKKV